MRRWFLGLLCLVMPTLAWAETSLWRVSQDKHFLLIGGTVHLLRASDYPLPDEFEQAFRESRRLVLETDMDALLKPDAQAALVRGLIYNDGSTLRDHLKPSTFRALAKYCRSAKLSLTSLQGMKPALVMLTLTLSKLEGSGSSKAGVDQFYLQKARIAKKPVSGLESVQTQIETLASLGAGQEDDLLLATLKDLKTTGAFINNLTKAWRTGNLHDLEKWGIEPMLSEFPSLNQDLLAKRNSVWLGKIEDYLQTPETELILIGALHLAGNDGLLAQLQKRGYHVQKY